MGWGDSSDEESFNEDTPVDDLDDESTSDVNNVAKNMEDNMQLDNNVDPSPPAPRTYDLPTGPPYTLFVGNLSYSIKDGRQLGEAIGALVRDRMKKEITIVKGRIGGGNNGRNGQPQQNHRGYGYVELGSLEEVSLDFKDGKRVLSMHQQLLGKQEKIELNIHHLFVYLFTNIAELGCVLM